MRKEDADMLHYSLPTLTTANHRSGLSLLVHSTYVFLTYNGTVAREYGYLHSLHVCACVYAVGVHVTFVPMSALKIRFYRGGFAPHCASKPSETNPPSSFMVPGHGH